MSDMTGKRVLIADDEPGIRKFLESLLSEMGLQVETAENGHEAFRKATREEYDVVFMDIAMPEWNGIDSIRSLKLVKPEQRIIVISAFLDQSLTEELEQEENVVGIFNKPVEIDALTDAVKRLISVQGG